MSMLVKLANGCYEVEDFQIPEDKIKYGTDIFQKFDKRKQCKLSTNDLGPAFREMSLTVKPDQLKEWADLVDEEATGYIDLEGFLIIYGKKLKEDNDERDLRDAFRVLDKNKNGEIDVEDLRHHYLYGDDLTDDDVEEMIRSTDTDGSGTVDFDEFYKLMTSE